MTLIKWDIWFGIFHLSEHFEGQSLQSAYSLTFVFLFAVKHSIDFDDFHRVVNRLGEEDRVGNMTNTLKALNMVKAFNLPSREGTKLTLQSSGAGKMSVPAVPPISPSRDPVGSTPKKEQVQVGYARTFYLAMIKHNWVFPVFSPIKLALGQRCSGFCSTFKAEVHLWLITFICGSWKTVKTEASE